MSRFSALVRWAGVELNTTSHAEKLLSGLGALLALGAVCTVCHLWLDGTAAILVASSMGASAVLLFAVPHGTLSQPWPVIGGHLVSAAIGVACQQWLGSTWLTPALATGLAICAMQYLGCLHPPGGATALAAVIGGPAIHQLGYGYLVTPILVNVALLMAVALIFNNLFSWRRYPLAWMPARAQGVHDAAGRDLLSQEDLNAALRSQNSIVAVSTEELAELFEVALKQARQGKRPLEIKDGECYSNGLVGAEWSVRRVVRQLGQSGKRRVHYKVVAGADAGSTGSVAYMEFLGWARVYVHEVEGLWLRQPATPPTDRPGEPEALAS